MLVYQDHQVKVKVKVKDEGGTPLIIRQFCFKKQVSFKLSTMNAFSRRQLTANEDLALIRL